MDLLRFEKFRNECSLNLPKVVDEILSTAKQEEHCAIGLITTDDISADTNFLYQPLVDIVDNCEDIDLCSPSKEKWDFAVGLLTVLQEVIKQLPDEIFQKNSFKREDVLFFATMGDGDYIYEMLNASVKMFNERENLNAFGVM